MQTHTHTQLGAEFYVSENEESQIAKGMDKGHREKIFSRHEKGIKMFK